MMPLEYILERVALRATDALVCHCDGSKLSYFDSWVGALRAKIRSSTE